MKVYIFFTWLLCLYSTAAYASGNTNSTATAITVPESNLAEFQEFRDARNTALPSAQAATRAIYDTDDAQDQLEQERPQLAHLEAMRTRPFLPNNNDDDDDDERELSSSLMRPSTATSTSGAINPEIEQELIEFIRDQHKKERSCKTKVAFWGGVLLTGSKLIMSFMSIYNQAQSTHTNSTMFNSTMTNSTNSTDGMNAADNANNLTHSIFGALADSTIFVAFLNLYPRGK